MVTIKDVAKEAGVSIGTVSNYVTGTRNVTPKTAKIIQDTIERLNYKPNSYAKNLRTSENREIGVVLPSTYEQYYSFILSGIEQELQQAGYYFNFALTNDIPEQEISALNRLLSKNICGLIVVSSITDRPEFFERNFLKKDVPVVFIDRKPSIHDINFATIDYYETTYYLLNQLSQQDHKRIGLVCGLKDYSCEAECVRAYQDFCTTQDITVDPNLICHIKSTKEESFRLGMTYLKKMMPDAVITTSQMVLSGLRQAATLLGITPAEDITMVSFGEEIWNVSSTKKGIINTSRPAHELGKTAATLLLDNLESPLIFEKQQIVLADKIKEKDIFASTSVRTHKTAPPSSNLSLCLLDSPKAHSIIKTQNDFLRKTGIHLDIELCDHHILLQRILESQSRDTHADIYMYDNPWLDLLVENDCFENISDFMFSGQVDRTLFLYDLVEKVGAIGDAYFGLPILYGPQLLLYRKDLFEDAELCSQFEKQYRTKLHLPRTWFEFNVLCKFFTQQINPHSPVAYGTSIAAKGQATLLPEFLPRLWAYGTNLVDENGSLSVDTPSFKKALANFIESFSYCPPQTNAYTVEQTVQDFYLGNTAMFVGFASFISDVNNYTKSKVIGKIGYANIPGNRSVLGSWGLGIAKGSPHKQEAFKFLKWISDDTMSNYFAILDGQSPLETVYLNDEMVNHYPWLSLIHEGYPFNCQRKSLRRPDGSLVPITEIERVIYKKIGALLKHSCTIDEAVRQIQIEGAQLIQRK